MTLEYFPDNGFKIDLATFEWGEERMTVRDKLGNKHQENNNFFDLTEFFDGDESHNFEQRRDIYHEGDNYFFLCYDKEDKLNQLEIHGGLTILIDGIKLEFGKNIHQYLRKFRVKGKNCLKLDDDTYLIEELKMTIADSKSMGGEGNGLNYFYSAQNIDHLLEE